MRPVTFNYVVTAGVLILVALAVLYALVDPASAGWMPKCVFHSLTGYDCPGCGSQRMIHALLHGRWSDAWHYNAFLMVMMPFLAIAAIAEFNRRRWPHLYSRVWSMPVIYTFCASLVGWTILRNCL